MPDNPVTTPTPEPFYYLIDFDYPGPLSNHPDDAESAQANLKAEKRVVTALESLKQRKAIQQFKHAYSWTDGSPYYYVATTQTEQELKTQINRSLNGSHISARTVDQRKGTEEIHKIGFSNLAEYMRSE